MSAEDSGEVPLRLTAHAQQRLEERGYSGAEQEAVLRGERPEACIDPRSGNVVTVLPKGAACRWHEPAGDETGVGTYDEDMTAEQRDTLLDPAEASTLTTADDNGKEFVDDAGVEYTQASSDISAINDDDKGAEPFFSEHDTTASVQAGIMEEELAEEYEVRMIPVATSAAGDVGADSGGAGLIWDMQAAEYLYRR